MAQLYNTLYLMKYRKLKSYILKGKESSQEEGWGVQLWGPRGQHGKQGFWENLIDKVIFEDRPDGGE